MGITRWLRSFAVLALLLLASAASSHGADTSPPPARGRPPTVVVSAGNGGFHWADAGVGAAAMFATTLLALGLLLALRPDDLSNRKP
jgi:hypothetical protein